MEKFTFISKNKLKNLPQTSGVYSFYDKNTVLYIGKAINIKNRVKNHFQAKYWWEKALRRSVPLKAGQNSSGRIGFIKTDSEIEALILEANLIKKYQPKFNVAWKDDKNFFYVAIAQNKNKTPYIFITHQPKNLKLTTYNLQPTKYIGPFTDGKALKITLRVLRRIFPFYSTKNHSKNLCPYCHLGLCPGPARIATPAAMTAVRLSGWRSVAGGPNPDLKECKTSIKNLVYFLQGKKKSVLKNLKKEMDITSKNQDFEKAGKIRDKIFALENILSHKKILNSEAILRAKPQNYEKTKRELKKILGTKRNISKIEGYDISNIQGKEATGSMVIFINGKPEKSFYRKFRIKTIQTPNDIAMLKEVLSRRFGHDEWQYPDLILIDGGKAQLNVATKTKNQKPKTKNIKVASIAKRNNDLYIESRKKPIPLKTLPPEIFNLILQIRDEAHRFAIAYHKTLRKKSLLQ